MRTFLQFIGASLMVVAAGCPSSVPGLCDNGACDSADGGRDAIGDGGGDVQVPEGCDDKAEPKDAPKCVVNKFGVFVDANGADGNTGTRESPVKTIGAALGKLAGKPRVYVCEGAYAEHVKLTSAVAIYGGFACGSWTYSGTKAKVAPTDAGYALHLDKVADTTVIADLTFVAQGGSAAATSSVAAFANASPKVTLRRVELTAGGGFAGKSPVKAADGALATSTPTPGTLNGNGGGATNGGLAQLCTCVGGATSKGGGGGSLNSGGEAGDLMQAIPEPSTSTGVGQTASDCNLGLNPARPGSNAPNVLAAAGAKRRGDVTETGWIPEAGKSGAAGGAGQGGGGGGGAGGGGGGGACGGCGGAAGESGGGGARASPCSP